MKAQDQIIHDSLRETKLADERLSPYATCNTRLSKLSLHFFRTFIQLQYQKY